MSEKVNRIANSRNIQRCFRLLKKCDVKASDVIASAQNLPNPGGYAFNSSVLSRILNGKGAPNQRSMPACRSKLLAGALQKLLNGLRPDERADKEEKQQLLALLESPVSFLSVSVESPVERVAAYCFSVDGVNSPSALWYAPWGVVGPVVSDWRVLFHAWRSLVKQTKPMTRPNRDHLQLICAGAETLISALRISQCIQPQEYKEVTREWEDAAEKLGESFGDAAGGRLHELYHNLGPHNHLDKFHVASQWPILSEGALHHLIGRSADCREANRNLAQRCVEKSTWTTALKREGYQHLVDARLWLLAAGASVEVRVKMAKRCVKEYDQFFDRHGLRPAAYRFFVEGLIDEHMLKENQGRRRASDRASRIAENYRRAKSCQEWTALDRYTVKALLARADYVENPSVSVECESIRDFLSDEDALSRTEYILHPMKELKPSVKVR